MAPDFAGTTAELYARYRRDLPADQAASLADAMELRADDVLVDLGCGTGQLIAPLLAHCRAGLALDPEPAMLAGLRARGLPDVLPVLAADSDLPSVGGILGAGRAGDVGALVIGNAAHWMDLDRVADTAAALLRPGGCMAVVTQGPPMWLGNDPWQVGVRTVLEDRFGPVADTCGSDEQALQDRARLFRDRGWRTVIRRWDATHRVDTAWILGHLGSALPAEALDAELSRELVARLESGPTDRTERVQTTALLARLC